jgi:hypothetical protein
VSERFGDEQAVRDEFLSEEDLDLRNLTDEELLAYWQLWLEQAQATNDLDAHTYSHGVFEVEPSAAGNLAEIEEHVSREPDRH